MGNYIRIFFVVVCCGSFFCEIGLYGKWIDVAVVIGLCGVALITVNDHV